MKSRPAKQIVHKRTKKVATVEDLLNTDERKALAYNLRVATVDFMEVIVLFHVLLSHLFDLKKGVVLSKYAERVRCFPVPLAQMALNYIYFSNGVFPDDVPRYLIFFYFNLCSLVCS